MIAVDDRRSGLDIAQTRSDAIAFGPSLSGRIVAQEEGSVAGVIEFRVGADLEFKEITKLNENVAKPVSRRVDVVVAVFAGELSIIPQTNERPS